MKHQLSPKQRFLNASATTQDQRRPAALWADITVSPLFAEALETALCEMVARLGAANLNDAAVMAYRIEGAKQVLHILANLGEAEVTALRDAGAGQLHPV